MGWWLFNHNNGTYTNSASGKTLPGTKLRKDGFVARNVRPNLVRKEVVSTSPNNTIKKVYPNIDPGSINTPTKAVMSLAKRTKAPIGGRVTLQYFDPTINQVRTVSTGYVELSEYSLSAALNELLSAGAGSSAPGVGAIMSLDITILGHA